MICGHGGLANPELLPVGWECLGAHSSSAGQLAGAFCTLSCLGVLVLGTRRGEKGWGPQLTDSHKGDTLPRLQRACWQLQTSALDSEHSGSNLASVHMSCVTLNKWLKLSGPLFLSA